MGAILLTFALFTIVWSTAQAFKTIKEALMERQGAYKLNGRYLKRDDFFVCLGDVNCETVLEVKDCVQLPGNDNVHCVCPNCGVLHEYDLDLKKVVKISSLKDKKLIDNGL